ncbi:unnamed protein product [Thlaspi arvense]|uniref:PPM-type phosphatase domain-containing protein n=1 Tax=Thlaspi arvense TaxID=13288 RepID=A0AAU9SIL3_THLAR|nr:unnamed protein product [Thlaspi arvense]
MAPVTEVSPMINNLEVGDDKMANLASSGKPPRNISAMRHCNSTAWLNDSVGSSLEGDERFGEKSPEGVNATFQPVFRSGSCSDKGPKRTKKATRSAFVKTDHALADASSLDRSSGTTALTALILDKTMLIANAGDSRAVLGKRGRAIELSKDHKPNCTSERLRIEKLGGVIYDGYLNGQLSVARALGDWHIKGTKGSLCPLSCEPELEEIVLTEEDEFLIMGCDGLWDVMSSQCAVTMVRRELMQHNDPEKCSQALVKEALQRNSCDNLTVVVVCFSMEPPPRIEIPKSHKRRSISAEGLDLLKGVLNDL